MTKNVLLPVVFVVTILCLLGGSMRFADKGFAPPCDPMDGKAVGCIVSLEGEAHLDRKAAGNRSTSVLLIEARIRTWG